MSETACRLLLIGLFARKARPIGIFNNSFFFDTRVSPAVVTADLKSLIRTIWAVFGDNVFRGCNHGVGNNLLRSILEDAWLGYKRVMDLALHDVPFFRFQPEADDVPEHAGNTILSLSRAMPLVPCSPTAIYVE